MRYLIVFLALSLGLDACASSSRNGVSRSGPNLIVTRELTDRIFPNTYEAVRQLRPRWVRSRGPSSLQGLAYAKVYLNGAHYGGLESLRRIPVQDVAEIRFLSASDATTRFGTGHVGGIIMVITRSGPA